MPYCQQNPVFSPLTRTSGFALIRLTRTVKKLLAEAEKLLKWERLIICCTINTVTQDMNTRVKAKARMNMTKCERMREMFGWEERTDVSQYSEASESTHIKSISVDLSCDMSPLVSS